MWRRSSRSRTLSDERANPRPRMVAAQSIGRAGRQRGLARMGAQRGCALQGYPAHGGRAMVGRAAPRSQEPASPAGSVKLTAYHKRILRERDEREAREDEFWQQAVRQDKHRREKHRTRRRRVTTSPGSTRSSTSARTTSSTWARRSPRTRYGSRAFRFVWEREAADRRQ